MTQFKFLVNSSVEYFQYINSIFLCFSSPDKFLIFTPLHPSHLSLLTLIHPSQLFLLNTKHPSHLSLLTLIHPSQLFLLNTKHPSHLLLLTLIHPSPLSLLILIHPSSLILLMLIHPSALILLILIHPSPLILLILIHPPPLILLILIHPSPLIQLILKPLTLLWDNSPLLYNPSILGHPVLYITLGLYFIIFCLFVILLIPYTIPFLAVYTIYSIPENPPPFVFFWCNRLHRPLYSMYSPCYICLGVHCPVGFSLFTYIQIVQKAEIIHVCTKLIRKHK